MIPAEVIAEIRARHELVAFIESAGVQLRRRGADYVGLCPFHADHHTPSLVVSSRKQYWCCHCAGQVFIFHFLASSCDGAPRDEAWRFYPS